MDGLYLLVYHKYDRCREYGFLNNVHQNVGHSLRLAMRREFQIPLFGFRERHFRQGRNNRHVDETWGIFVVGLCGVVLYAPKGGVLAFGNVVAV
ncbi:MAG: hypothetical protein KDB22_22805 [Planctomycetales bacterium]|nr:hypothetical protein [Planctomycetales bacterium]